MDFYTLVKTELERINQKVDRILSNLPATQNMNLDEWLTEEQTQELLHRGATSLWELRKKRKIKATKLGGRTYYSRTSIIDYLEKNKSK